MSDIKLKAASGGGSISLKGPSSLGSDRDLVDTSGNINLLDNQKVKCGDSTDLQIYHSSSSGNNIYQGNSHQFWNAAGDEVLATFAADGKCELYHNGQKCLQTQPDGGVETMDGNFIIGAAGHGIQFDTANSGTDQLLDDYEEGTFTPVLGGVTNHSTYNVSGSALYTKIGRLVNCQIFFSDKNLNDTAAGQVRISGLPFTSSSAVQYTTTPTGYSYNVSFTTDRIQSWYVNTNATTMDGMQSVSGAAWVGWDVSNFLSSDMHLRINLTYYAA